MRSINEISQFLLAIDMRWLVDTIEVQKQNRSVLLRGWIISLSSEFENLRILVNGAPVQDVDLIPSADLGEFFPALGADRFRRFVATHAVEEAGVHDGLLRFSLDDGLGEAPRSYRDSWFYPHEIRGTALPSEERIRRVIGTDSWESYLMGGATIAGRLDLYLRERFQKSIREFDQVLDWGCGAARVTQHLLKLSSNTWGADVDKDNVEWCNQNIRMDRFHAVDLSPPMPFGAATFDLIIGISIFTHLSEENQFLWLRELARITKPGGIVLASVHGFRALAYNRLSTEIGERLLRDHFVVFGTNDDMRGYIDDDDYYLNVLHSPSYIFAKWSSWFEIVDIVPVLAVPQDVVVMRKR